MIGALCGPADRAQQFDPSVAIDRVGAFATGSRPVLVVAIYLPDVGAIAVVEFAPVGLPLIALVIVGLLVGLAAPGRLHVAHADHTQPSHRESAPGRGSTRRFR